nr:Rab family GTPase [Candidatus Sigynarchaeota archaeon]
MASGLIRGIVYSVFDQKIGPVPYACFPPTLSEELTNRVAESTDELKVRIDKVMKQLCQIPLPQYNSRILVKMFEYNDVNLRGHSNATSLALLFNEADDLIFYRYFKDFEEMFEKFAIDLNELQENHARKEKIVGKINEIYITLDKLVESLRDAEMARPDGMAFPDGEQEQNRPVSKTVFSKHKIIVCGDPAVGKTSTILQYTNKAFKRTYLPTVGVNLTEKALEHDGKLVNFIIWDIAGHAKFSSFRKQFYAGAHGAILVYDITDLASFRNIKGWVKDVKSVLAGIPVIVLGNKNDLESERKVPFADLEQLGKELSVKTLEISAKTGENVIRAFELLAEQLGS